MIDVRLDPSHLPSLSPSLVKFSASQLNVIGEMESHLASAYVGHKNRALSLDHLTN